MANERMKVAVLAATGSVGQRFVQLLDGHPMFEVTALTGSERREGQTYAETCHWILPGATKSRTLPCARRQKYSVRRSPL